MCTTILPTKLWDQNFNFLLLIFFYWFLITKNKSKLEILQVFGNFLRKFSMGPHKTWFTCMLWVISSVWKMSLVGQFFGPFLIPNKAKIGNFGGFWPFSQKKFDARLWNLVNRHIVGTFRLVWKITLVGQIFGPNIRLVQNRIWLPKFGYQLW